MPNANQAAIDFAKIAVETLYDQHGDADTYSAFVAALIVHAAKIGKAGALISMFESVRHTVSDTGPLLDILREMNAKS